MNISEDNVTTARAKILGKLSFVLVEDAFVLCPASTYRQRARMDRTMMVRLARGRNRRRGDANKEFGVLGKRCLKHYLLISPFKNRPSTLKRHKSIIVHSQLHEQATRFRKIIPLIG